MHAVLLFLSSTYLTDEHLVPKKLDLVYVVAFQEMVCEKIKVGYAVEDR